MFEMAQSRGRRTRIVGGHIDDGVGPEAVREHEYG